VRIVYKVFGNHVDGTYLAVDDSHAHMNMPATLMWARGFDMRPVRVTFQPPPRYSWKPATQLYPTSDPWTFTAPNLQYLMDSPTELSDYTLRSFKVHNADGKEYTIRTAVHHDGDPSVIDDYAAGAEKIVNEAAAVFGEFPAYDTGTYTFLGDYVPWGGGDGMEHRNSTVVAAPTSFKNPQAARAASAGISSGSSAGAVRVASVRDDTASVVSRAAAGAAGAHRLTACPRTTGTPRQERGASARLAHRAARGPTLQDPVYSRR